MTTNYWGYVVVSTDFSKGMGLRWFKRIVKLQLYFRGEGKGTVVIQGKRDTEYNWQGIGVIDLTDVYGARIIRRNLTWSKRARDFDFRMLATNAFRFLGMIIVYEPDGGDR
jgi:hypothetical protein